MTKEAWMGGKNSTFGLNEKSFPCA